MSSCACFVAQALWFWPFNDSSNCADYQQNASSNLANCQQLANSSCAGSQQFNNLYCRNVCAQVVHDASVRARASFAFLTEDEAGVDQLGDRAIALLDLPEILEPVGVLLPHQEVLLQQGRRALRALLDPARRADGLCLTQGNPCLTRL